METFEERQKRENEKTYRKWLSCGFTGEMKIDEHGWCRLDTDLAGEEFEVFNKCYTNKARISITQLPNKKWISGSDAFCRTHGHGYGLSIWNKQYESKEDAIEEALDRVAREIDEKDKSVLLKKVEEFRCRFKKDTLYVSVETERFEQVSLF